MPLTSAEVRGIVAQSALWLRSSRILSPHSASAEHTQLYGQRVQDISRRSAMKAAAWSVPVIAVAAATPLAAASGPGVLTNAFAVLFRGEKAIVVHADTGGAATDPRPEHFSVIGLPPVQILNAISFSTDTLYVDLVFDSPISPVGRMLTINIPGFAPVTIQIVAG